MFISIITYNEKVYLNMKQEILSVFEYSFFFKTFKGYMIKLLNVYIKLISIKCSDLNILNKKGLNFELKKNLVQKILNNFLK